LRVKSGDKKLPHSEATASSPVEPSAGPAGAEMSATNGRVSAGQLSPLKSILKTSLPAVVDLSSQTIMWTVESILIGHLSAAAFAGVGMALQIIVAMLTLLLTFIVGASLIINRCLGAGDKYEANHIFAQTMMLGICMAILLGLFWFFGATNLFKLIKEGGMAAEHAGVVYLRTLAVFAPFFVTNFIALGVVRSVGDTKYSMMINVGINTVNLVLAPLLIFGHFGLPRLEVQGAALAAGIAHTCGFCATFYLLRSRRTALMLSYRELAQPNWETFKRLFKTGLPATVEQLVWAFGQLVVTSYVALLGVVVLAAHQVFMRIQAVLSMIYMGFGMSAMTLMGKNLGAAERGLAEKTAEISGWVMYVFVMVVVSLLAAFSGTILRVFSTDPDVIKVGAFGMYVFAFTQVPKAVNNVLMGNLRGAGDLQWLMWLSIAGVVVFHVGLNWAVVFLFKWPIVWTLVGVWLVHLLDETTRLAANYWRFRRGKWKYQTV
jgi:putative MATE family efflux protein